MKTLISLHNFWDFSLPIKLTINNDSFDQIFKDVQSNLSLCKIQVGTVMHGLNFYKGWSGGAMVLGKLPVPGRPTI